jgi:hypothetical protein
MIIQLNSKTNFKVSCGFTISVRGKRSCTYSQRINQTFLSQKRLFAHRASLSELLTRRSEIVISQTPSHSCKLLALTFRRKSHSSLKRYSAHNIKSNIKVKGQINSVLSILVKYTQFIGNPIDPWRHQESIVSVDGIPESRSGKEHRRNKRGQGLVTISAFGYHKETYNLSPARGAPQVAQINRKKQLNNQPLNSVIKCANHLSKIYQTNIQWYKFSTACTLSDIVKNCLSLKLGISSVKRKVKRSHNFLRTQIHIHLCNQPLDLLVVKGWLSRGSRQITVWVII